MAKIVYTGEMDPRLCKNVLGETIPALAERDPDVIYLDADLMSCIGTGKWAKARPDRAVNCGIAEANMVGVACGLASAGFKPIVHTFGPFASRRCYDQAFLSGGYAKNDITIIGTDPGVTATMNGGTHMPFEDVALYRALPGSTVIDVTDPALLISVLGQCVDRPGVKFIRVGRKQYARVYAAVGAENHNKYGGLWSAVSEVLAKKCPIPADCVAVEDEFGEVGPQDYLQERFGLTAAHIVEQAKAVLARK